MSSFTNLLGSAPEFATVLRAARIVAATDATALLLGESGTGKELLAHAMHAASGRAAKPFVTINCAALPEALAESELFGHRKGAFTGAHADNPGRLQTAHHGTVFLDEVGELPLALQAKLLRFLESGECQAVGHTACERVDVRIIAATNRDLRESVKQGRFREDLYYRLYVVPLELPPLRQRGMDIPMLLDYLTEHLAERHRLTPPRYAPDTLALLRRYPWPGNVRELRNFCERMLVLFSGRSVAPTNLPDEFRARAQEPAAAEEFLLPESGVNLESVEAALIRQALCRTDGNRSRAARLLGLSRDTLLYRLKKYAI